MKIFTKSFIRGVWQSSKNVSAQNTYLGQKLQLKILLKVYVTLFLQKPVKLWCGSVLSFSQFTTLKFNIISLCINLFILTIPTIGIFQHKVNFPSVASPRT